MTNSYYCHFCADELVIKKPLDIQNLNMTGYFPGQTGSSFEKFFKHNQFTGQMGRVSIYKTPDYETYRKYGINAYLSGCVEIDKKGRTNILWYAGKEIGLLYNNGTIQWPEDTVKLVLHDQEFKFHHFSQASSIYRPTKNCCRCGKIIPFA